MTPYRVQRRTSGVIEYSMGGNDIGNKSAFSFEEGNNPEDYIRSG